MRSVLNNKQSYIDPKTGLFFPYQKEGEIICQCYLDIRTKYGVTLKEKAFHKLMVEWFDVHGAPYVYEPSLTSSIHCYK